MAALPEPLNRKELPCDGSNQKQSPNKSGIQKQECLGPGWSLRAKHGYILEAVVSLLTLAAELQGYYCCLALSSTALKKSMIGWWLVLSLRKHDWLYESVFSSLDANGAVIAGSPSRSFLGPTLDFRLVPTTP